MHTVDRPGRAQRDYELGLSALERLRPREDRAATMVRAGSLRRGGPPRQALLLQCECSDRDLWKVGRRIRAEDRGLKWLPITRPRGGSHCPTIDRTATARGFARQPSLKERGRTPIF